jgi:hypothetical protein
MSERNILQMGAVMGLVMVLGPLAILTHHYSNGSIVTETAHASNIQQEVSVCWNDGKSCIVDGSALKSSGGHSL